MSSPQQKENQSGNIKTPEEIEKNARRWSLNRPSVRSGDCNH